MMKSRPSGSAYGDNVWQTASYVDDRYSFATLLRELGARASRIRDIELTKIENHDNGGPKKHEIRRVYRESWRRSLMSSIVQRLSGHRSMIGYNEYTIEFLLGYVPACLSGTGFNPATHEIESRGVRYENALIYAASLPEDTVSIDDMRALMDVYGPGEFVKHFEKQQ